MKIELGDKVKIPADGKFHPEAGHFGVCVWISEDRETVAVRCDRSHHGKKNTVFLVRLVQGGEQVEDAARADW